MSNVFCKCDMCQNIIEVVNKGEGEITCCDKPMRVIKANTVDAAVEKHVPFVEQDGKILNVTIGEVEHPMVAEHYIQWIVVTQGQKTQRVCLSPEDKPKAQFILDSETEAYTVLEYCNLHGLWKK